jgi:hypothetical protein
MAPEHKFATSARLCQEILGATADGALPLSECAEVIGDALRVLSCKTIKVAVTRFSKDADLDSSDPQADAQALAGAAKGRLVSQMMKKHLVEAVVPVIIELKRMMEASRHPLLADLMAAAAAMLKDHKSEIEDILAADRQLAKEILYDIKQAEAAEAARAAEEKEIAALSSGAATAAKPSAAAAVVPAKTPGTRGLPDAKTPHTVKNLTTGPPTGMARQTPRSNTSTRPPGTSGHTPIAAQVLGQATTSTAHGTGPGSSDPTTKTPGSNLRPTPAIGGRATPLSGVAAAGAAGKNRTTGGRRRSLSRLARMSSRDPGTAPRTGGTTTAATPLTIPEINPSPAQARLRPGHEKLDNEKNLLSSDRKKRNPAGGVDDNEEEEEEDHVELQFVIPGVDATTGAEAVSPKMWNVSAAVLPATCSGGDDDAGDPHPGVAEVDDEGLINRNEESAPLSIENDGKVVDIEEEEARDSLGRSRRTRTTRAIRESELAAAATEPKTRRKRKA